MSEALSRSEALLGEAAMRRLDRARVLVVGVGGVGSWCAEALVRTGVGGVTLVDDDCVAASNVNRQAMAFSNTLGRPKAEALAERLRMIRPEAEIRALCDRYAADGSTRLLDAPYDVVVDAIDSVDSKARLILDCCARGVCVVSSMGAAFRTDPAKVRVTRFEKVEGDGLAKALRAQFKKIGDFPRRFSCVWSAEAARPAAGGAKGSVMQVTATFGLFIAAEVIRLIGEGEAMS